MVLSVFPGGVTLDPIAQRLLETVRQELGYKEKSGQFTKFGQWYADRVQDNQFRNAPWCDMFLAWAADKSGLTPYVGEFAWTPSHAAWFMKQGAWSQRPEPGALVFYDWRGGKSYKGIDHVGIVERVKGKKIHTIEANVDGVWLKRKVRETDKVVGYGVPRLVKANADRAGEIPGTEQPFVRPPQSATGVSSPLDFLGTPPALLAAMVLATVLLSLRFTRRRGIHRRFTWPWPVAWPWNEPDGPGGTEEAEARRPAPIPETFRGKLTRVGAPPVPRQQRKPSRPGGRPEEPEQPRGREPETARARERETAGARERETAGARERETAGAREREPVRVGGGPGPEAKAQKAQKDTGAAVARHSTPSRRKPYDPR
ncbi:CHAP domain-containing protein [Nonomuraea bangladeshensis]|uniref:CHAP domain-containing protein n=1 Tax=Nonomuraea bangladeshensis TaxID=404385 RepID=UPI0031DF8E2F